MEEYENEIWKPIEGYEGLYEISSYGRIYSYPRLGTKGGIIKPNNLNTNEKYLKVKISKNGVIKKQPVHKLVAVTFIPNPNNYPCVNHKDENKRNNNVDNLEWCTIEYNDNYGTRNQRIAEKNKIVQQNKRGKTVLQYTLDGEFVAEYPSIREAERQTNISNQHIGMCCKGLQKTAGGFVWKYKN